MNKDEILQALEDGYKEFSSGRTREASKIWLPTWKAAQDLLMKRDCKNEKDISGLFGVTF